MTCVSCPDGLFLNQTSVSCAACPPHSRVPGPANASSVLECACEAGHTNSSSACGPCALASYKPALGNETCTACPLNTNTTAVTRVALNECLCAPGFFFNALACAPCATGSFKGHVSNEACAPCPVDTYCPVQSVVPVACVGNSSRLAEGGVEMRDCLCPPGFFTEDSVSRTCNPCPVGTFNALLDQTNCTACPAGTVNRQQAAEDASACISCGANAAALAGSSDATACACNLGFAGEPGATCVACATGKFRSNMSEYICHESPADTYNAEPLMVSHESCLACPEASSTTGRTGSGSQLDCVCQPCYRPDTDDASAR